MFLRKSKQYKTLTPTSYLLCRHNVTSKFSSPTASFCDLEIKIRRLLRRNEGKARKPCTHCTSISRKLLIGFMCKAICSAETRQQENPRKEGGGRRAVCHEFPPFRKQIFIFKLLMSVPASEQGTFLCPPTPTPPLYCMLDSHLYLEHHIDSGLQLYIRTISRFFTLLCFGAKLMKTC